VTEAEERERVRRAQTGDAEAFAGLVMEHQRFVYHLALRALGSPQDAEDVAQEAFVRAWLALPNFRGQARFQTWLYRIVTNLCYNRLPRLRREMTALGDEEMPDIPDEASGAGPLSSLEAEERRRFLHQAIERLPENYRLLVTLRFQQELSYEEIASVTSLPLGTVKTGLFRARARLREALREFDEVMV
jgi:RNA polymerase sigma-70 factor (ECF subfamily)